MNLKPYSEYKDSDVPWLGKVPKEWELKRLGSAFFERKEKVSDKDFPPLSVTKNGILPQLENAAKSNDGDNRKKVVSGDFVINSRSDRKGSSGLSKLTGSVSLINTVLIPFGINDKYTHKLLKSHPFKEEFYRVGRGIVADLWSTKYSEMRTIMVPLPPLAEQAQIARFLDWKTAQIAKFIKDKKRMIELLKEQKQVIINNAVTGKIDVATGKPYAKYKDSGVEWFGRVPDGWEVRKLKHIAKMKSGESITSISIEEMGEYPVYGGNGLRGYYSDFTHSGEFLLIGRQGALCGNVHFVSGKFWASEHAVVTTTIVDCSKKWLYYLLTVMDLNQYSESAAQPGISVEKIQNLRTLYPSKQEQNSIVSQIEKNTTKIDLAISRTEREISLMQEYRDRLIADVVTGKVDVRGIDVPDVVEEISVEDIESVDEEVDEIEEVEAEEI